MTFNYSGLSQYFILTKSAYDNLESYSDQAIYFIKDTQEIFRGEINYSKGFIFCTSLPNNPLTSKAYINTTDNTLNIYTGSTWLSFGSLNTSVSSVVEDNQGNPVALPVNGTAIVNYLQGSNGIVSVGDISDGKMNSDAQVPLTIVESDGGVDYVCSFTKSQDSTCSLGVKYTYATTKGGTAYSTKVFAPGSYNEYSNIIEILTELGEDEISKAKAS